MLERNIKEKPGNQIQVNEKLINQFNYLQQTIGNQEVQNLINAGIITAGKPAIDAESIIKNQNKKQDYEAAQIAADRLALDEEIKIQMAAKKTKAETMLGKNPTTPVYVNVTTELIYAQIPGDNSLEFYHYTKLKGVDFSLRNVDETGRPVPINRGKSVTVTYSFLLAQPAPALKSSEEEAVAKAPEKEEEPQEEVTKKPVEAKAKIKETEEPQE